MIDNPSLGHIRQLHWYHWVILLGTITLTLFAWQLSLKQEEQRRQLLFSHQTDQILQLVRERMQTYEQALWAGAANLHANQQPLNAASWRDFSNALSIEKRYPGINGIGFIRHVKPEQLDQVLRAERRSRPNFTIFPEHTQNDYWPITYIEPLASNHKAIGLDMAHEQHRLSAARRARDTGLAQITGPIVLVQDDEKRPGFLFFAPFYRTLDHTTVAQRQADFVGLVYAPFIVDKLMYAALKNENRLINFSIADGDQLLYTELNSSSKDFDPEPLYSRHSDIDIFGRQWHFTLNSSILFRSQSNVFSNVILFGGILLDSVIFFFIFYLTRFGKQATLLAHNATRRLRDSEYRLQATIDQMIDGLVTLDKNAKILSLSSTAETMLDCREDDLIGQSLTLLMPDISDLENQLAKIRNGKTNQVSRQLLEAQSKSGHRFPVELTLSAAEDNEQAYFIGSIRNLTEQTRTTRALAEKQALLDTAVLASASGFAIQDASGNFAEINESLCHWLGYQRDALLGAPAQSLIAQSDCEKFRTSLAQLLGGQQAKARLEIQFNHSNGSHVWGLCSAAAVQASDSDIGFVVINVVDIDQQRSLQQTLQTRNAELEKSNADLDEFAYIASHDLRSPLIAIQKISGWIEEDCEALLPDSAKQHLTLLKARAQRMLRLLEDLLSYSRATRESHTAEIVNLQDVVKRSFELLDAPPGIQCRVDSAALHVARVPLETTIRNLLNNAVKHHYRPEGLVQVNYALHDQWHVISVTDDGPGIPPELHTKALEMFQTLRPRDEVEGSGMGLAMVRKLVEYQKGEIRILSDGSRGTEIQVRWPAQTAA